jgi:hypothetical protein
MLKAIKFKAPITKNISAKLKYSNLNAKLLSPNIKNA